MLAAAASSALLCAALSLRTSSSALLAQTAHDTTTDSTCILRVYVYPLSFPSGSLSESPDASGAVDQERMGVAFTLTNHTLYNTSQFALYSVFANRLQSSRCVVADAEAADAYFIPLDLATTQSANGYLGPRYGDANGRDGIDLYNLLVNATAHGDRLLSRYGGRDHFLISSNTLWDASSAAFHRTPSGGALGNAVVLGLEDAVLNCTLDVPDEDDAQAACREQLPRAASRYMVPYPSVFHDGVDGAATDPEAFPWRRAASERRRLAYYGAGRHGQTAALREMLDRECAADARCRHVDFVGHYNGVGGDVSMRTMARGMLDATFCLQPEGDTPSRKGIVDALLLGCIPVLFTRRQLRLWPWHWEAASASVFVDGAAVANGTIASVLDELARVPERRVRELQAAVEAVAYRMQYSASDVPGRADAFDIAMQRLRGMIDAARAERLS